MWYLLSQVPGNGIARSYWGNSFLALLVFSTLISRVSRPIYNSKNKNEYYVFPTSHQAFVVCCFVDLSHSDWHKMKSQSLLICIFPIARNNKKFLRWILAILFSSCEMSVFWFHAHFLNGLSISLILRALYMFFYYCSVKWLSSIYSLQFCDFLFIGLIVSLTVQFYHVPMPRR